MRHDDWFIFLYMKSNCKGLYLILLLCSFATLYSMPAKCNTLKVTGDTTPSVHNIPERWINEIRTSKKLALSKELIRNISSLVNPDYKDTLKYKAKAGQWEEANLDNDPENEIIIFTGMKERATGINHLYILDKKDEHWQIIGNATFTKDFQSVADLPAFQILEGPKLIEIRNSISWGNNGYGLSEKRFYAVQNNKLIKALSVLLSTYQANGYEYLGGSSSDSIKNSGTIKVVYSFWINVFNKFFPEELLPDRYKTEDYVPIDIFDNNFVVEYKWDKDSLRYLPDYKADKILQAKTEYINQLDRNMNKPRSPFVEDIRKEARKGNDLQKYYVNKRGY